VFGAAPEQRRGVDAGQHTRRLFAALAKPRTRPYRARAVRRPSATEVAWGLALLCAVLPLWSSQALPLVDLPQHLHLISVLHRLDDGATLYPELFARRPELTPYLGYYYAVSALSWVFPIEAANRLFLSAYVAGLPLSLAFLLRALGRPAWPALLSLPFAYGDSFAWGFINYCASLPLALLTCGLFVRAIGEPARRRGAAIGLGFSLVAVLLFHVQAFAWLALALPLLLFTTPAPEGRSVRARAAALLGVVPGVLMFAIWVALRMSHPQEIAPGQPWKAWGPMLSDENLAFKPFAQNLDELVQLPTFSFPLLAGITHDGSDQYAVRLVFLIAGAAALLALRSRGERHEGPVARQRMLGLFLIALALFFALPFDIRGYMYYLNTRYAHLAAALLVCAVPPLPLAWARRATWAAALAALVLMLPLRSAFAAFDRESRPLATLARAAADKPRVMGLIYRAGSGAVRYPVFLHGASVIARERGGLTNFSFASTPHSPLMYRGEPPPTFPSEWRPHEMRWETQGRHYDHFLVRGRHPREVFGRRLENELYLAAEQDDFYLVRRR
jgi:hypothetical protein